MVNGNVIDVSRNLNTNLKLKDVDVGRTKKLKGADNHERTN